MAVIRDGHGPYAPFNAVMAVIEQYRDGTAKTPFTPDNLPLSVTPSLAPRTLQSLRVLDLIDDDGQPTAQFESLREAEPAELQERLGSVVRAAYADIFAYRDPATAAPDEIIEAFRRGNYKPQSVRDRMVRLFYGLCEAGGIISEIPRISEGGGVGSGRRSGGAARTRAATTNGTQAEKLTKDAAAGQARPRAAAPTPPAPVDPPTTSAYPTLIRGLLEQLPTDRKFSKSEYDRWMVLWGGAVELLYVEDKE